jgi:hypothetical protein
MKPAVRRAIQVIAFAAPSLALYATDLAPPGMSALLALIVALLALCALLVTASARPPTPRTRRRWLRAAVVATVLAAGSGLWYRSMLSASVFVYAGDHRAHIAGSELTPAARRLANEAAIYDNDNALLLAAQGQDERVWTQSSIARVQLELTALYLVFILAAATAGFSAAELLRSPAGAHRREPGTAAEDTAPVAPVARQVILFLAANPSGTSRLALDEECAAIEKALQMSTGRDDFDLRSKWAVSIDDMMQHLNDLRPTIVHFSGHGGGASGIQLQGDAAAADPSRDIESEAGDGVGIALQGEHREVQYVQARALAQMIGSAAPFARLVVLNACFSDGLAEELDDVVDCVVGMRGAIGDDAARAFAVGFYRALGARRSVGNAVAQAAAALGARQLPDEHLPICRTRAGIDADAVILVPA